MAETYKFAEDSPYFGATDTYQDTESNAMSFKEALASQDRITGNQNISKFYERAGNTPGIEVTYDTSFNPNTKGFNNGTITAEQWKPSTLPFKDANTYGSNVNTGLYNVTGDGNSPNIQLNKDAYKSLGTDSLYTNHDGVYRKNWLLPDSKLTGLQDYNSLQEYNTANPLSQATTKDFALAKQAENQATANKIGWGQMALGATSLVGNMLIANENRKIKEDALDYQKKQDRAATAKTDKFQRRLGGL